MAIHSARGGDAPSGMDGTRDAGRSMDIRSGEEALATQTHPIIRKTPETGREGLFGCAGYIIGIDDMDAAEALPLLYELVHWQGSAPLTNSPQWTAKQSVMLDNPSVFKSTNARPA